MPLRLTSAVVALLLGACSSRSFPAQHRSGSGGDSGVASAAWSLQTLDTSALSNGQSDNLPNTLPQLAMAVGTDDTVGVAFYAPQGLNDAGAQLYDLRYLSWKAGVASASQTITNVRNVSGLSVAFAQPGGSPAVSFLGGAYPPPGSPLWTQANAAVAFASGGPQGGGWTLHIAAVGDDTLGTKVCPEPGGDLFDNKGTVVGLDTALVFIHGKAQVAYRDVHYGQGTGTVDSDFGGSDLKLASGGPTSWTYAPVDCSKAAPEQGGHGGHTQLVVGDDGFGALVEDTEPAGDVPGVGVYFRKQDSSGLWSHPTTALGGPFGDLPQGGPQDTLSGPTLSYDSQVGYGVAVYDNSAHKLFYTESTSPLTRWSTSLPLVGSGSQGWYPSLAFDPVAHQPSVAFYYCSSTPGKSQSGCSVSEQSLQIISRLGGNWQTPQVVDSAGALLPKLGFLSTGKRVIVYKDPFTGFLKLAAEK